MTPTTPSSSNLSLIKMVAQEPLAKLADRQTYWIRIVADKQAPQPCYAVAAMRCENREELHWLSVGRSTPGEVARLMRTGFELPANVGATANEIIQELLRNGNAVSVDPTRCAAVAA